MSDDLVKRLRAFASPDAEVLHDGYRLTKMCHQSHEAADRIEELGKAFVNMQREYDKRGDRIEELKAKLEKAEVIIRIIASDKWDEHLGEAVDLSCEYLAELKGEQP